jgi:hypothetical protein
LVQIWISSIVDGNWVGPDVDMIFPEGISGIEGKSEDEVGSVAGKGPGSDVVGLISDESSLIHHANCLRGSRRGRCRG